MSKSSSRSVKAPHKEALQWRQNPALRRKLLHPSWLENEPWYKHLMPVAEHLAVLLFTARNIRAHQAELVQINTNFAQLWLHLADCADQDQRPDRRKVIQHLAKVTESFTKEWLRVDPAPRTDLVRRAHSLAHAALTAPEWTHAPWARELISLRDAEVAPQHNGTAKAWGTVLVQLAGATPDMKIIDEQLGGILHLADHGNCEIRPFNQTERFLKGLRAAHRELRVLNGRSTS